MKKATKRLTTEANPVPSGLLSLLTIADFDTIQGIIEDAFGCQINSDQFKFDFTVARRATTHRVLASLIEGLDQLRQNQSGKEVCHG